MLTNIPLVSVVITTFNRREMLARAIDSVAKQTYKNVEIVVSDDCSEYDIENLIEQKRAETDFVIKLRVNEKNSGACYTRNQGIKLASGEFVAGLDDDDEFTNDRLEYLVSNYKEEYSFITSDTLVVTKNKSYQQFKKQELVSLNDMLWENVIGTQILVKRDRILDCGGFDETLSSAQDADMWLRLIIQYGSAMRLAKAAYILHTEHDAPRITTSKNKIQGMIDFKTRYDKIRNNSQKKLSDFRLAYWMNNRKIKLSYLRFIDFGVLKFFLKKTISSAGKR